MDEVYYVGKGDTSPANNGEILGSKPAVGAGGGGVEADESEGEDPEEGRSAGVGGRSGSGPGAGGSGRDVKVVVIGAGVSGLHAACCLLDHGFRDVVVLEAQDEVGGRIRTLPMHGGKGFVELGAQWIHGRRGNLMYKFCQEHEVALSNQSPCHLGESLFLAPEGQLVPRAKFLKHLEEIWRGLSGSDRDGGGGEEVLPRAISVGSYVRRSLKKLGLDLEDPLLSRGFEFFHRCMQEDNGCLDMDEISLQSILDYTEYQENGNEAQEDVLLEEGFGKVLDVMVGKLKAAGVQVRLGCPVQRIDWEQAGRVRVVFGNSRSGGGGGGGLEEEWADHVFCTVSLGCLKALHAQMFYPALPDRTVRAIEGLSFGNPTKVFLQFDCDALPPDLQNGFCLLWPRCGGKVPSAGSLPDNEEPLLTRSNWYRSLYVFHRVLGQPAMLQGWANGRGGQIAETLTETELLQDLQQHVFSAILAGEAPSVRNDNILTEVNGNDQGPHGSVAAAAEASVGDSKFRNYPPLKRVFTSKWLSNPWVRGGFSYRTTACEEANISPFDLAQPLLNTEGQLRVQFCGEATDFHRFSTTDGALNSAEREVARLARFYLEHSMD